MKACWGKEALEQLRTVLSALLLGSLSSEGLDRHVGAVVLPATPRKKTASARLARQARARTVSTDSYVEAPRPSLWSEFVRMRPGL